VLSQHNEISLRQLLILYSTIKILRRIINYQMQPKPKPWDIMTPEHKPWDSGPDMQRSLSEPSLNPFSRGQPKALDTRVKILPARAMSPLEILQASREGLDRFDPTGNWYRPDAADDHSASADIDKWRAEQTDLYAKLDARVAARETEKSKKLKQYAAAKSTKKAYHRMLKNNSMASEHKPWTYCDAPDFFERPSVDSSPSRMHVKNDLLTGIWNGLEGMKTTHHECNVHGGWNYSQRDSCTGLHGTFKPKPAHRMSVAEKKTAATLERRLKAAQAQVREDALQATSGIEKRQTILLNAEKFSANSGEAQPWKTQSVSTHTFFGNERPLVSSCKPGVDMYLDGDTKAQITQTSRAHDHSRNFVAGNGGATSKWNAPPAGALVGTRRRRDLVEALIDRKGSRSVPAFPGKERRVLQVTFKDPEPLSRYGPAKKRSEPNAMVENSEIAQIGAEVIIHDVGRL